MYNFEQIRAAVLSVRAGGTASNPNFKSVAKLPHLQELVAEIRAEAKELPLVNRKIVPGYLSFRNCDGVYPSRAATPGPLDNGSAFAN